MTYSQNQQSILTRRYFLGLAGLTAGGAAFVTGYHALFNQSGVRAKKSGQRCRTRIVTRATPRT